jgi:hypothetical protein
MPLSVVSMLGRLGGDPWATASHLAGQPRDAAVLELAEIITGTARAERSSAEIMTIATRLASLLPGTGPRSFHHGARPEARPSTLDRWNAGTAAALVLAMAAAVLFLRVAGVL